MARVAFKMRLLPGAAAVYKEKHDQIWPALVDLLHANGLRNYSIFQDPEGLDLFAYVETDTPFDPAARQDPAGIPDVQREWWLMMEPYMEYNDDHTPKVWPLVEVFHLD